MTTATLSSSPFEITTAVAIYREVSQHLMTGPKGKREFFMFPRDPRGKRSRRNGLASENIEGRGETKLTVSRGAIIKCFVTPPAGQTSIN